MKFHIISIYCRITIFLLSSSFLFSQHEFEPKVLPGIDVLAQSNFEILAGKRIALLTNNAGRSADGVLTVDILKQASEVTLSAILVPEHGFYTTIPAGEKVEGTNINGIPVHSLYGEIKSPDKSVLELVDAVVVDLQDIGIRSYTYLSTLVNLMKVCAEIEKSVVILDRPNPLGGMVIDGGTVESEFSSFVSKIPIAYIHGCTFGELAEMINGEGWLGRSKTGDTLKCPVMVIPLRNWQRWMQWEDTKLKWTPTSPHIPSVDAVRGAAVLGPLGELGIISIGIGTTLPFQYIGSPDFDLELFEGQIPTLKFNGLVLQKIKYRPFYGMYSGKNCSGYMLRFHVDNLFAPYTTGIKLIRALRMAYPEKFKKIKSKSIKMFNKVTGTNKLLKAIKSGLGENAVLSIAREGIEDYLTIRNKYLLY